MAYTMPNTATVVHSSDSTVSVGGVVHDGFCIAFYGFVEFVWRSGVSCTLRRNIYGKSERENLAWYCMQERERDGKKDGVLVEIWQHVFQFCYGSEYKFYFCFDLIFGRQPKIKMFVWQNASI